jgi:diguanylate cyclase (GGDEF)-like protein/PAS domain S-box-containing protein
MKSREAESASHTPDFHVPSRENTAVSDGLSSTPPQHSGVRPTARSAPLPFFERALEQMADQVVIMTNAGIIEYVNPSFERLLGRDRRELVGLPMNQVLASGLEPRAQSEILERLQSGHPHRGEQILKDAEGHLLFDEVVISPLCDPSGTVVHFVLVGRDTTPQHSVAPLTGLPNRRTLVERIALAAKRARRLSDKCLAVMFVDIDQFKSLNDTYGREVGDQVIIELGHRLTDAVREIDVVAHVGHLNRDEFAILFEDLGHPLDAEAIAERLTERIRASMTFCTVTLAISASIGIVVGGVELAAVAPEDLLRNAETAMMRAKRSTRRSHEVFVPDYHSEVTHKQLLAVELRSALATNQLVLYYQPIVSLETGLITGAEALLRWRHPERGLVPPMEFIPAAEENGLIIPLGRLALRETCRQLRTWMDAGVPLVPVSVNVSARQFRDVDLVEYVESILMELALPPSALRLEITESTAAENAEEVVRVLARFKTLGVQILLDDFGTGYSSLSYLTRLPLDKLKIDRSFITNMVHGPHAAAVVTTIIAMAKNLNLGLVAEGVETEEQLRFLRHVGCGEMQGYLFSKPAPPEDYARMLLEGRQLRMPDEPKPSE